MRRDPDPLIAQFHTALPNQVAHMDGEFRFTWGGVLNLVQLPTKTIKIVNRQRRSLTVTNVPSVNQCADIITTARGRGANSVNERKPRLH